ncbi:MAG: toxic anion resistance protein [Halomonas sp.]|nr:toxic anion resistance protein [Halomonas sp.]MDN6297977.1 toxic anion resistance protein [Halomonas sp.]MDN6314593.1 toxic anion resistance protein [Halomonas sp.]MDN6336556.1 toxic anion resistance protein [Halomonas sp.]
MQTPQDSRHSALQLPSTKDIAAELERRSSAAQGTASLLDQAEHFVAALLTQDTERQTQRRHVDELGAEIQRHAAYQSELLKTPMRTLAEQGENGGPVAEALTGLKHRMSELDPQRHRLSKRGVDRVLAFIPGMKTAPERYFHKYESAQQALDAIIHELESGRDRLGRDNLTLADDQQALEGVAQQLLEQIELGQLIDQRLVLAAEALPQEDTERRFIEEELLFPLRQRVVDLQQQLAVSQQGVLALEVLVRNNRELMRGVDRAINVTVSALSVAVTVALGLANQRLVLDKVEALNATTSNMIAGTAQALRQQGSDIQARAGSAMLDMQKLEQAFGDVMAAIDEVSRYRREALPQLAEQTGRLDVLSRQGGDAIARMQRGRDETPPR